MIETVAARKTVRRRRYERRMRRIYPMWGQGKPAAPRVLEAPRLTRRRWRWDPKRRELVEVGFDSVQVCAPAVFDDLPGYQSPVTGIWIEGRRARREDLKRTGCRPYEGREQEEKHAAKVRAGHEREADSIAEKMAHRAWAEAPERVRRVFRGR